MLSANQRLRPTAASLVTTIIAVCGEEGSMRFCGICCASDEDEFSDFVDELEQGLSIDDAK